MAKDKCLRQNSLSLYKTDPELKIVLFNIHNADTKILIYSQLLKEFLRFPIDILKIEIKVFTWNILCDKLTNVEKQVIGYEIIYSARKSNDRCRQRV